MTHGVALKSDSNHDPAFPALRRNGRAPFDAKIDPSRRAWLDERSLQNHTSDGCIRERSTRMTDVSWSTEQTVLHASSGSGGSSSARSVYLWQLQTKDPSVAPGDRSRSFFWPHWANSRPSRQSTASTQHPHRRRDLNPSQLQNLAEVQWPCRIHPQDTAREQDVNVLTQLPARLQSKL
jgi:hypothetical protein